MLHVHLIFTLEMSYFCVSDNCGVIYTCITPFTQLSYGASSPSLSNTVMFPNFFRTIPSEVQSNSARFALMQRYNWTRVATLHETQTIFSQVHVHVDVSFTKLMYMYNHVCTIS